MRKNYHIEFRFFGKSKYEIKQLIREADSKFHLRRGHKVPHISLAGPFTTNDERRLLSDFKKLCSNQELMNFEVDGFNTFEDRENRGVVFIDVKPSNELNEFRWQLSKTLQPYCELSDWDYQKDFSFHATLAMKLNLDKLQAIKKYIASKPQPKFKHVLMRATLLKNKFILCEYDFLLKRPLTRREALDKNTLEQTYRKLNEYLASKGVLISQRETSLKPSLKVIDLDELRKNVFGERRVFFISDNHFDHTNIIRYCKRPFSSTSEMNETMLRKWNDTIKNNDIVFFLGDLTYGKGSHGADHWLDKLNGDIYFIKGNHERIRKTENVYNSLILRYKNQEFFLVHDPKDVPSDWKGWAICGHHHNNKTGEFPLVNKKTKKINVSVELIDYTPIAIDDLLSDIENNQDKTRCNYHLCRKQTTLLQCPYCKNHFCSQHIRPLPPLFSRFQRTDEDAKILEKEYKKGDAHPCFPYFDTWAVGEQSKKDKWGETLDVLAGKHRRTEYVVNRPTENTKEFICRKCGREIEPQHHYSSGLCRECYSEERGTSTNTPSKSSEEIPQPSNKAFGIFMFIFVTAVILLFVNNYSQTQQQTTFSSNLSCPVGYQDLNIGKCVEIRYCSDKTKFGDCSNTKPLYCDGGLLVERSDLCGCPAFSPRDGFSCGRAVPKGATEWVQTLPGKISSLLGNIGNKIQNAVDEGVPEVQKTITQVTEAVTPEPLDVNLLERNVHDLINVARRNNGLSSLGLDSKLSDIARKHSQDMVDRSFFAHINPNGQDPTDRGNSAGYNCHKDYGSYYTYGLAENIFLTHFRTSVVGCSDSWSEEGVAKCVVDGWMDSPGHRQNILTSTYGVEGIGVAVSSNDKVLVTEDFC